MLILRRSACPSLTTKSTNITQVTSKSLFGMRPTITRSLCTKLMNTMATHLYIKRRNTKATHLYIKRRNTTVTLSLIVATGVSRCTKFKSPPATSRDNNLGHITFPVMRLSLLITNTTVTFTITT